MKLVHLSDLHLLALEGLRPWNLLSKRASGYANLRFKRKAVHRAEILVRLLHEVRELAPDHVVITGDLTNLALGGEFVAVRTLLERELGFPADRVSIIPGNHDTYTLGSSLMERFLKEFSAYMTSDLPNASVLRRGFPFVRLRGPLAIVGLSSAVAQPPFVAAGRLGAAQLLRLRRLLDDGAVRGRTPVILVHHPVHPPRRLVKQAMESLHDATLLRRTVSELERGLILHGHLHRRMTIPLATARGALHSYGATSASLFHSDPERMAGFNVYDFDSDGALRSATAEVLDVETDTFRTAGISSDAAW